MARLIRQWPLLHHHCFPYAALNYLLSEPLTLSTKATSHRASFTKVAASNRGLRFRPRGPKLPDSPTPFDFDQGGNVIPSDSEANKSRNQKKREARRAVRWGMELASFSPPQIKRIIKVASLEKDVFDALMLVKRLGPDVREGKRRQYSYIGKLLREVEPELMDALIHCTKDGDWSRLRGFPSLEEMIVGDDNEECEESEYESEEEGSHEYIDVATRWFDGLINRDIKVTNEVYSLRNIDFDRQELRKLVRRVHAVQERKGVTEENQQEMDTAITVAKESLTRFLHGLAKQMPSEPNLKTSRPVDGSPHTVTLSEARSLLEQQRNGRSTCHLLLIMTFLLEKKNFNERNSIQSRVWPGILSNADAPALSTTGFSLQKSESKTISAPASWGGRFWGRTYCSEDSTGKFSCLTGDCGSGKLECSGTGAAPPATLAEFKLDGYGGVDFYDVSLVDGYNLPLLVVPQGGSGQNCTSTGCVVDLNGSCPSELKVTRTEGESVACKSACEAFGSPQYCCNGAYSTPDTCKPSTYSEIFKNACPRAYSYAYDDKTSTFTCASADYQITFCPSPNTSQKASQGQNTENTNTNKSAPLVNSTMVYDGELIQNGASPSIMNTKALGSYVIAGIVSLTVAIWQMG
ncbi:hypothetical protein SADUNF_Sadunf05G0182700 [Salix dunnii]|uniref:Uncharacterized protein n=1 Tax=Salix dunnii TaxID=1413687 RepID=A0A835N2F8_9ROSI|nr:hypothetical protein SADUNF_Sadunf05G0182700 [Salix dunnii]